MMKTSNKILLTALATALLSACAGQAKKARSDFDYLNEKSREPLQIPEGMDAPQRYNDFQVPQVKNAESMSTGPDLVITAPAQVLTLLDGSIRPQDGNRASIEFDVTARAGDAPAEQIWQSIQTFLQSHNVEIIEWHKDRGVLLTDWYVSELDADPSYFFGLEDYLMERRGDLQANARYLFQVQLSPSGRTAKLSASMEAFERYVDGVLERSEPTSVERDNFTVNFLNGAVMQYQKDVASLRQEQSKASREALALSLQKDDQGEASILVAAPFEQAWPQLGPLLEQAGFELDDQDKVQATYFVIVSNSWLYGLFGMNDSFLEMASGDYKILLADKGESTELTFFDDENQPVSADEVEKAYEALKLAMVKFAGENEERFAPPRPPKGKPQPRP